MIPSEIKYDANATPPHWTDNADQVIEKGTNVRIKIKGVRSEVDKQYAIGTMKEVCVVELRCVCCRSTYNLRSCSYILGNLSLHVSPLEWSG